MELLEAAPETGEALNAVALYSTEDAVQAFIAKVRAEVESHVPDVSTTAGRKAIASLAFKVSRTKTAADNAGKALVEAEQAKINAMNGHRRTIRDTLDALRDRARAPLDEWEAIEKARVEKCQNAIALLKGFLTLPPGTSLQALEFALGQAEAVEVAMPAFADFMDEASGARQTAIATLNVRIEAEKKAEADRAELARLRAEAAEREKAEAAAKAMAEAEAAEKARIEAERLAAERQKAEEAQRIADAAEKARKDAEEKAQRDKEAEIERVRAESDAKIKAAQDEAARIQKEADDRASKEAAQKAEDERRARDAAHRRQVRDEAVAALVDVGNLPTDKALAIFDAIAAGVIPHLSAKF